jgi:hypothetical protein
MQLLRQYCLYAAVGALCVWSWVQSGRFGFEFPLLGMNATDMKDVRTFGTLAVRAAQANAGLNGMQERFAVVKCGAT